MNLTANTTIRRGNDLMTAKLDGEEMVMMSIEQGRYFGLDNVASRIWTLLEQPLAIGAICDTLMGEFDVERSVCERDVLSFLAYLAEQGLIEVVDGQAVFRTGGKS